MLLNAYAINAIVINGGAETSLGGHFGAPGGRYVSDEEVDRILTGNYGIWPRVWVEDAAGAMRDYSVRDSLDWGVAVELQGDIDAPISTATVKLWREQMGTMRTLAPLRSNAAYNVNGPAINAGRKIQIDVACPGLGATPTEDDYRIVFQGYVDSVDWAANPMTLECRDKGAVLADAWYIGPTLIGASDATQPIQDALVEMLEKASSEFHTPLYVPVLPDPEVDVGGFKAGDPNGEPVMDALQRLVQVNGWDLRYRFADAYGEFRLTFKDPGRLKTEPDFTLWPYSYIDIKQLKIDRIGVRNEIWVWYRPDNDLGNERAVVLGTYPEPVFDSRTSGYGRRVMVIQEADDSPINSEESAQRMADLITFDLAFPKADKIVEMPFCWFLELQDLIRFPSNGVHWDGDLDLAIVGYRHVIDQQQSRTTLTTRGSPAGSFFRWLSRRPSTGPDNPTDDHNNGLFSNLKQTPNYSTDHIVFSFDWNGPALINYGASAEYAVSVQTSAIGPFSAAIPLGTDTFLDFTLTDDIEPFDDPGESRPQTVQISFKAMIGIDFGGSIGFQTFVESGVNTVTYRVIA